MITPFSKILLKLNLEAQTSKLTIQIKIPVFYQTTNIEKWYLLKYLILLPLTVKITS